MNNYVFHIGLSALRVFIAPLTLIVTSYLIVNKYGKELWGSFVVYMLLVDLMGHMLQWGSKDHLVRIFSQQPRQIRAHFYQNFYTRALLLIPGFLVITFLHEETHKIVLLFLWMMGLFVYHSAESLIVYEKRFPLSVITDAIALVFILFGIWSNSSFSEMYLVSLFTITTWLKAAVLAVSVFPKFRWPSFSFRELVVSFPFFVIGLGGLLQSRADQYIIAAFCDEATVGSYQIFFSAFILLQVMSAIVIVPFNKVLFRIGIELFHKIQKKIAIFGIIVVSILGAIISLILNYLYLLEIPRFYYLFGILFAFPSFVYGPIIYLFYRVKKEKEVIAINYLGAMFNLLVTLWAIFYSSPFNAIVASAMAQWIMLFWYLYRRKAIYIEINNKGHQGT